VVRRNPMHTAPINGVIETDIARMLILAIISIFIPQYPSGV
jgi:hypothetical protein